MTIDIRATTTCNLGTLISASISDDYVQNNGLIKTSGSCELATLVLPKMGTSIVFEYTINGITRKIPRVLKVLSSFADPFRGTTSIEFGCPLTYMQDVTEPIRLDIFGDPINSDATEEEKKKVLFSISAQYIGKQCLNAIGLQGDLPLTNLYTLDGPFDLSSGYVNVLSDLLVSESYCGYVGIDGKLKTFSVADTSGSGKVIKEDDIIDVGPLNFGDLPGDTVTVSYSVLRLTGARDEDEAEPEPEPEPEPEDPDVLPKLNWELETSIGGPVTIRLSGTYDDNGEEWECVTSYRPATRILTEYDEYDRVKKRITREYSTIAGSNDSYAKAYISFYKNTGIADTPIEKVKEEYKYYAPVSSDVEKTSGKPEGYDKVTQEVTINYEPEVTELSGFESLYSGTNEDDTPFFNQLGTKLLVEGPVGPDSQPSLVSATEVREVFFDTYPRQTFLVNGSVAYFPTTKTFEVISQSYCKTANGRDYLSAKAQDGENVSSLLAMAKQLVQSDSNLRIVNGREAVFEARPDAQQRLRDRESKKSASNNSEDSSTSKSASSNGPRTEETAEIELIYTNYDIGRKIEFTMPYAPDDRSGMYVFSSGSGIYNRVPSSTATFNYRKIKGPAAQKAALFGRVQNSLLMGNRNGISLQLPAPLMPSEPFSKIAVQARGITGVYATNGTSWTIDSNGIIASTDALLLGAAGKA